MRSGTEWWPRRASCWSRCGPDAAVVAQPRPSSSPLSWVPQSVRFDSRRLRLRVPWPGTASKMSAKVPGRAEFPATDDELLAACVRGEQAAWDVLVERYAALIYSIPLKYGLADAD